MKIILFIYFILIFITSITAADYTIKGCVWKSDGTTPVISADVVEFNITANCSGTLVTHGDISDLTDNPFECSNGAFYSLPFNDVPDNCAPTNPIIVYAFAYGNYSNNTGVLPSDGDTNQVDAILNIQNSSASSNSLSLSSASPTSNYIYTPNNVSYNITISNQTQLSQIIFSSNYSGSWQNYTYLSGNIIPRGNNIYSYIMKSLSGLVGFNYFWFSNDTTSVSNISSSYNLQIQKATSTSYILSNKTSASSGETINLNCTSTPTGLNFSIFNSTGYNLVSGTSGFLQTNYIISQSETFVCNSSGNTNYSSNSSSQSVTVTASSSGYPTNIQITKLSNSAINLTWNSVSGVDYYIIYYSSNLSSLKSNLNNPDVFNFTSNNPSYTDSNFNSSRLRYYRIASSKTGTINASSVVVGKQTLNLYGSVSTDSLARQNVIGFVFNMSSYSADSLLNDITSATKIIKLKRDSGTSYEALTHVKGKSYGNFSLDLGEAYILEVTSNTDYTIVGTPLSSPVSKTLSGMVTSGNKYLQMNLYTIPYSASSYTAESLLQSIGSSALKIQLLNKTGSSYTLVEHIKAGGNDFALEPGIGYYVYVDTTSTYSII